MGFWDGVARGMESNEAQRNVEAKAKADKAADAKADQRWKLEYDNRIAEQKFARTREDALLTREQDWRDQDRLDAILADPTLGRVVYGSKSPASGSGSGKGGTPSGGTKKTLEHSLAVLDSYEVEDSIIESISGFGAGELSQFVDSYAELNTRSLEDYGVPVDANEYFAGLSQVSTQGNAPTVEQIAQARNLSDKDLQAIVVGDLTMRQALQNSIDGVDRTTRTTTSNFAYIEPLDWSGRKALTDEFSSMMSSNLTSMIRQNAESDGPASGRSSVTLEKTRAALEDGDFAQLDPEIAGEALLQIIEGNPAAIRSNIGPLEPLKRSLMFGTQEEADNAFINGDLRGGQSIILDGQVVQQEQFPIFASPDDQARYLANSDNPPLSKFAYLQDNGEYETVERDPNATVGNPSVTPGPAPVQPGPIEETAPQDMAQPVPEQVQPEVAQPVDPLVDRAQPGDPLPPKGEVTVADIRADMDRASGAIDKVTGAVMNANNRLGRAIDVGFGYTAVGVNKIVNGALMAASSNLEQLGFTDLADNLLQSVADSVNNRENVLTDGFFGAIENKLSTDELLQRLIPDEGVFANVDGGITLTRDEVLEGYTERGKRVKAELEAELQSALQAAQADQPTMPTEGERQDLSNYLDAEQEQDAEGLKELIAQDIPDDQRAAMLEEFEAKYGIEATRDLIEGMLATIDPNQ